MASHGCKVWAIKGLLVPAPLVAAGVIYGVVIIGGLAYGTLKLEWFLTISLTIAGFIAWTLFEYGLHRYILHEWAEPLRVKWLLLHWRHHDHPKDPCHIVTHPIKTLPVAVGLWGLFRIALGASLVWPFFAGFGIGYLWYETIHLLMHQWLVPPFRFLRPLWQHHAWHHYREEGRYFGVTTRLWDKLFRTA